MRTFVTCHSSYSNVIYNKVRCVSKEERFEVYRSSTCLARMQWKVRISAFVMNISNMDVCEGFIRLIETNEEYRYSIIILFEMVIKKT